MTMFERVVSQVILGYLGRYFKDIQKHQLKITLWKGVVFLENVELSLEAFDYLRLSFALKEGWVGKLSIKIPWKKLGWDPIEIILEDVFLCASQRDDQEAYTTFGLKLSSLRTMKQTPLGSSGRRGGQVNKVVEITGLEFYCGTFRGEVELMTMNNGGDSKLWHDRRPDGEKYDSILSPCDVSMALLGMLHSLEVNFDAEFFLELMNFFGVLQSFEGQHGRVLLSLNGIENVNGRLLSKAEYILSHLRELVWDFSIFNIIINVPWRDAISEQHNSAIEAGSLILMTRCDMGSHPSDYGQSHTLKNLSSAFKSIPSSFELKDLYDHFEVKLNDLEMKMIMPSHSSPISILEKLSTSISLERCLIQDESLELCSYRA